MAFTVNALPIGKARYPFLYKGSTCAMASASFPPNDHPMVPLGGYGGKLKLRSSWNVVENNLKPITPKSLP